LRRQIQSRLVNATEKEIDKVVQQERARLNLKWCFDEYFGGPIPDPILGRIITANVFGTVHLGYIVNITSFSITLVSVDTLTVLPTIGPDDIYSAENSPFFHNYLHSKCVYHPQHVLDWWSKSRCNPRRQCVDFSASADSLLFPMCNDVTSDWPQGEETRVTHDILPQRSQFVNCTKEALPCIPAMNNTGCSAQPLILLPDSSPVLSAQPLRNIHCSSPDVLTTARQHHSSVWVGMQNPVVTKGQQSSMPKLRLRKRLDLLYSSLFQSSFERQSNQLFLFPILIICLITALPPPVKSHAEGSSLTLDSAMVPDSLFCDTFYPPPLGCLRLLHDIKTWDWFRALAVP
jgi:hypothetical protein